MKQPAVGARSGGRNDQTCKMVDPRGSEGEALSARARDDAGLREWAARQPLGFGLVVCNRVHHAEERRGGARLAPTRVMATRATRSSEAADPLTGSHDCSALALTARVRRHGPMPDDGGG